MTEKRQTATDEIRCFIAIDISDQVRRALSDFIRELKPAGGNIKWVRVESIHLTLKFLGNIATSLVPEVKDAMERAADGIESFEVKVEGAGAFPNLRKPRVFWAGMDEPTGKLAELAHRVENELKSLGFEPENRPFRPHLTIGRVKRGGKTSSTADMISKEANRFFGAFPADELILFKSELKPDGAVYTKLEKVTLRRL